MPQSTENLALEVNALPWFHQIDFGNGLISSGAIKLSKIRRMSRIIFDRPLEGKSVLDVGCWDGAYSLEATRRGAARVLATDHFVWNDGPGDRRAFDLVRQHLAPGLEVMDIKADDLTAERVGRFDVVLFLGVFYHLRNPISVLERIAGIAREVLVVETRMTGLLSRKRVMEYHPGDSLEGDATNFWTPNRRCMDALLRDIGFSKIKFKHPDYRLRRGIFHAERA